MDAVALEGVGDIDKVLVDHGNKGGVVFGGEVAEDFFEGCDVVAAVVGGQRDTREENSDVRVFKCGENLVEVATGLIGRQSAEAIVAAELDDDDIGVEQQNRMKIGDGVLGGGTAGTLIVHLVVVAAIV